MANKYNLFIRFPNVTIPQGSTITSAIVKFNAGGSDSGTGCNINCYFNNVDNAVAPTSAIAGVNLAVTGAVAWNNIESWTHDSTYYSPELKTILQTVINRPGWVSGNALQIVFKNNGSSTSRLRKPHSWDNGSVIPELSITYDAPVGSPSRGLFTFLW